MKPGALRNVFAQTAAAWMVVFGLVHIYWVVGGTGGLPPGISVLGTQGLLVASLIAIPLCLAGTVVALGLERAESERARRFFVRTAAGVSILQLAHAAPAVVTWGSLILGEGPRHISSLDHFSLFLYEPYWLLGGILFMLAAWTSHRRRPGRRVSDNALG